MKFLRIVYAAIFILIVVLALTRINAGVTMLSGGATSNAGYYPAALTTNDVDSFKVGTANFIYVDQKFYFNSSNTARTIDYNGYSLYFITSTGVYDSVYVVAWMLDYRGHKVPTNDSIAVISAQSFAAGDTLVMRLDNTGAPYNTQVGVLIRLKRQTTGDSTTASFKHGIMFN
jgi:hypothetical protein